MDKDSLIKIRNFLIMIDELDIPKQDVVEAINNISLFIDPENYEENIKIMAKRYNEELRWKNK